MEEQNSDTSILIEYLKKTNQVEEQNFDSSKLHEYLKQNLVDFPTGDGELTVYKFWTGTSNPTFLLGKSGKEFVLRQKSPVEVYAGYHKVDVEYKVMSALGGASFPVPKMYLFCEDKTIMGEEFYVMEYLKNRQFPDANLPGVPPDQRKAIFEAAIKTLAQLQSVDTDKLHLDGIGDKENFLQQRLDMLYEAFKRKERKSIPKAHRLVEWLRDHIPKDGKAPVIHHTDFRIANMLFHPEESQIMAVIDWEAASWGHPFEDLAYFCLFYHWPAECEFVPGVKLGYYSEGIPKEEALLSLYCELTGNTLPLPNWTFFMALVFFRAVVNMQTVVSRFLESGAESQDMPALMKKIPDILEPLVEHTCNFVGIK